MQSPIYCHPVVMEARAGIEPANGFRTHQRAFLEPRKIAVDDERWDKLKNLLHDLPNWATLRDLYYGKRIADDKADADRPVQVWFEEGRLRSEERKPTGAGRPATVYFAARRANG